MAATMRRSNLSLSLSLSLSLARARARRRVYARIYKRDPRGTYDERARVLIYSSLIPVSRRRISRNYRNDDAHRAIVINLPYGARRGY